MGIGIATVAASLSKAPSTATPLNCGSPSDAAACSGWTHDPTPTACASYWPASLATTGANTSAKSAPKTK